MKITDLAREEIKKMIHEAALNFAPNQLRTGNREFFLRINAIGYNKDVGGTPGGRPGVLYSLSIDNKLNNDELIRFKDFDARMNKETYDYVQDCEIDFVDNKFLFKDPKVPVWTTQ